MSRGRRNDEGINGAEQTIRPLPPLTPNVNTGTKRVTKQSALSDIVTSMEKNMDKQTEFFEEQMRQDRVLMEQFIEMNSTAERTQQAILKVITDLVNKQ